MRIPIQDVLYRCQADPFIFTLNKLLQLVKPFIRHLIQPPLEVFGTELVLLHDPLMCGCIKSFDPVHQLGGPKLSTNPGIRTT